MARDTPLTSSSSILIGGMPTKPMLPGHKSPALLSAKRAKKPAVKKMSLAMPDSVCMSCMPMGETQIIAMLLVAVFGLASVLTVSVLSLQQQKAEMSEQAMLLDAMRASTR